MKALHTVLVALVAAVTLASVAAAGPDAAKQRVVITMKNLPDGQFVLEPRVTGALQRDTGTTSVLITRLSNVMRDGQLAERYRLTFTLTGKRGTLTTQERNDWLNTGGPYVAVGTWKVLRGTGQYAKVRGGGRDAGAGLDQGNGDWYSAQEGFLTSP
jgi:hypothetical protein